MLISFIKLVFILLLLSSSSSSVYIFTADCYPERSTCINVHVINVFFLTGGRRSAGIPTGMVEYPYV